MRTDPPKARREPRSLTCSYARCAPRGEVLLPCPSCGRAEMRLNAPTWNQEKFAYNRWTPRATCTTCKERYVLVDLVSQQFGLPLTHHPHA